MRRYQRILDDCREAAKEVLSAPTPYLQRPELGVNGHLDIHSRVELRKDRVALRGREIRET